MIPSASNSDYPKFVADQVLTSDNLNDLFGYLDEQGRMTRTNLLGVGIVCGLKLITASDGTSIKITAGVGVTSSGFLVTVPEITYTKRSTNVFDAVKCEYYSKFVDTANTQRFTDVWELKQEAEETDTTALTSDFLNTGQKVVLLFVELLEENNKNCDPDSCDDKGVTVTVTIRPLLVTKAIATTLMTVPVSVTAASFNSLPDIIIHRWNIANTNPVNTDHIISAYQAVLTNEFISRVQSLLSQAYLHFRPVIIDKYPLDPFAGFNLVSHFAFLNNGTITKNQSLHIQYYYDLFSDLIAAYNEFCITGNEVISVCSPDESLFPRHLLLGEAIPLAGDALSTVRHYFIYSPLFQRKDLWLKLIALFRRMDLILKNFRIPPIASAGSPTNDTLIRITPSNVSAVPLSEKAIPYYYDPVSPGSLYKYWSYEKLSRNRANRVLSYYSDLYAAGSDIFVRQPLQFDTEPYNFLRVEGITGKAITTVLETVKTRIKDLRLPVKVVALATGTPKTEVDDDECCCLSDLELQFQLLRKQLLCCIKESLRFWGSLEKRDDGKGNIVTGVSFVDRTNIKMIAGIENILTHGFVENPEEATGIIAFNEMNTGKTAGMYPSAIEMNTGARETYLSKTFTDAKETSYAKRYLEYQAKSRIPMESLPAPRTNEAEVNISYYILIIIDELETLVELLGEENVEEFDVTGFSRHATTLDETYTLLSRLLTGYHSKGYQVAKIKVNTGATYFASVDQIGAAMAVISDDDTYNIITLIKNSSSTGNETTISLTSFIASLQAGRNNYSAQERTIRNYLNSIKDALMLVDRNSLLEPEEGTYTSEYSSILTFLKSGKCKCDIDKLKFLLERYREQRNHLTDLNNFSVYTQHNPGIEHKAGVTKGGTLIIVYKGANDPRADIATGIVVADFYLPYTCCSDCTPIEVTVQEAPPPVNIRPIAKPGGNLYIETPTTTSVTLDGSYSTDPDGTIMVYAWTKISAPAAGGGDLTNENTSVATASNFFVGVYTYKLTVTDDDGAANEDILTITVSEKFNNPPIAVATTDKSTLNFPAESSVQLRGENSTDPDAGTVLTHSWVLDPLPNPDNSGVGGMPSSNKNPAVTFTKTGLFGFKLTVTDNKGKSASDKVFVLVKDTAAAPNKIPVAEAKITPNTIPFTVGVTPTAKLDGTGSVDPDGTSIAEYLWALQPGITDAEAKIMDTKKPTTDVIFKKAGTYLITLTVFDSAGASSNDYVLATVTTDEKNQEKSTCAPLTDIIAQFNGLSGIGTPAAFKSFREKYSAYSTVAKFYQELEASNVASLSIQEQINFFNSRGTGSLLTAGINELQNLILEQTAQRPFALAMFNIHAQLAYYVECIQTLDIDKAKMGETFEALLRIVKLINQVVATFSSTEKNIYRTLRILTVSESDRVNSKGEQNSKKIYLKALTAIIEQIPATL